MADEEDKIPLTSGDKDEKSSVVSTSELVSKADSGGNVEETRSRIARLYVIGFFSTIGLVFVLSLWRITTDWTFFNKTKDLTDLLVTVSGILSGPLGFIIGYYFKSTLNNDKD